MIKNKLLIATLAITLISLLFASPVSAHSSSPLFTVNRYLPTGGGFDVTGLLATVTMYNVDMDRDWYEPVSPYYSRLSVTTWSGQYAFVEVNCEDYWAGQEFFNLRWGVCDYPFLNERSQVVHLSDEYYGQPIQVCIGKEYSWWSIWWSVYYRLPNSDWVKAGSLGTGDGFNGQYADVDFYGFHQPAYSGQLMGSVSDIQYQLNGWTWYANDWYTQETYNTGFAISTYDGTSYVVAIT